jgi:hypothetical protein
MSGGIDHMEWFDAASQLQWAISSLTDCGDVVIVSAVRWSDRGSDRSKHHTVSVARDEDHDLMLRAFKTMLRLEGV